MMDPFEIKTAEGKKYFYNIYNAQKDNAKALIEAIMPNIKIYLLRTPRYPASMKQAAR